MKIKYVSTNVGFILRECSYTEDGTNLFKRYAKCKRSREFGKTHHLYRKMRKTQPRGKVFERLIHLKALKIGGDV